MADYLSMLEAPPINPLANLNWGSAAPSTVTMSPASMGLTGIPTNPLTGSPDYLKSLQSPELAGLDLGSISTGTDSGTGHWWDGILGSKNADGTMNQGWGGLALGAAQGLGNAWMGMKQYGLAKDQLAFAKDQFAKNFAAQQKTVNARLEDQQRARVAANPGAYQSVGEYMKKYGI